MKVALVTPNYHQSRGNTITVDRISRGLNRYGIRTEIVSITEDNNFSHLPSADLVHGFNAYHFNRYWTCRGALDYPYLITITGTDLNSFLFEEESKNGVLQTLKNSEAIHVFNKDARNLLQREIPELIDKTFLIPQGIHYFSEGLAEVKKDEGSFIFLLPAGIRRVKNIPNAISMLTSLHEQDSRVRLWLVGPIIEEEEGTIVRNLVEQNSEWVRYLGELPHSRMGGIYRQADVVLNNSLSEGQSSAILEAMAMGIPVVVSNIAGNRDVVLQNKTGFLYSNEDEFRQFTSHLMERKELGKKMGLLGKEYALNHHSVEKEVQELKNIYLRILENKTKSVI